MRSFHGHRSADAFLRHHDACRAPRDSPKDLIDVGLYRTIATAFVSDAIHRQVSYKMFARTLGAEVAKRGEISKLMSRRISSLCVAGTCAIKQLTSREDVGNDVMVADRVEPRSSSVTGTI